MLHESNPIILIRSDNLLVEELFYSQINGYRYNSIGTKTGYIINRYIEIHNDNNVIVYNIICNDCYILKY